MKQPHRSAKKTTNTASDIDDDFFDGTVLESTTKLKRKALFESDEDLSDLPGDASTSRTKRRIKDVVRTGRAPSSSPPPITDLSQPQIEPMRKGVSKFDLRDDEWMMVEDEFLETAKLFTRHLHIAEYDRLKEIIEAKKKEAEIMRPVIAGARPSIEGAMKAKAMVQEKRQIKAIQDVLAPQNNGNETAPRSSTTSSARSMVPKRPAILYTGRDTDSEDLDAPRRPPKSTTPMATIRESPTQAHYTSTNSKSSSGEHPKPTSSSSSPAFIKPAPPSLSTKPRTTASGASHATPFDMLDEYVPRASHPATTPIQRQPKKPHPSPQPPSPAQPSHTSITQSDRKTHPGQSEDLLDDWGSGKGKEIAARIAKRKAERDKNARGKEQRVTIALDDIPTFLF